jgi:iron(III) transport system permease protein
LLSDSSGSDGRRRRSRLAYRLRTTWREPTAIIGVLLTIVFAYLIVVPIAALLYDSVEVQFGDQRRTGVPVGGLTSYYFSRALFSPVASDLFWEPLSHTLSISVGAIIISLSVGGVLAWLLGRTDLFGRRWFATALIVPYMLPSWTFALAWRTVFKNREVGGQMGWCEALGFTPPDWLAYGQIPITFILALHYTPFVILLFGNALRQFDSQLEESARMLGASPRVVARKIILPLMLPSLMSATVLIFAKCLGEFGVSYVLGLPVDYDVLATSLYRSISSRQPGVAAVIAIAIMSIGIVSLLIDARLVRESRKFVTVGGKGAMDRKNSLGKFQIPATAFAILMFVISVGLPLLVLSMSTVMRVPGNFVLSNFTLDYWIGHDLEFVFFPSGILLTPDLWKATWNTLRIVGFASVCSGLMGLLVGYVVVRSRVKAVSTFLRQVTFFPYLVPGIAFAAAYLSLFAVPRGPIPALYGTSLILILALMSDQMPFASRAGISAMMQLGKDPEEAAQVAGAGWFRRMISIVIPIQKGALVAGVLLPFISGIRGLSLFVILAVPGTDVLTTFSLRLLDYNYTQAANSVVLIISALAYFGTLAVQKLTKTNLADGLEG